MAEISGVLSFGFPFWVIWAASFSSVVCSGSSFETIVSWPVVIGKMSDAETLNLAIWATGLVVTGAMSPVADGFSSESAIGWILSGSEG